MRKITCEHCGSMIDLDHDKKCPTCKAPYSDNKEYKELKQESKKEKEYDYREREIDLETKQLQNKALEKSLTTTKNMTFLPVIVGLLIMVAVIFIAFNAFKQVKNNKVIVSTKDEELIHYDANFNELLITDTYEYKCDKITKYNYSDMEKKNKSDNTTYYNFHFIFNNKTNSWKTLNSINLTYTDENGNENILAKKPITNTKESKEELDFFAKETASYSGNITYEIPNYVKDVKIIFENTTIIINDFKSHIK